MLFFSGFLTDIKENAICYRIQVETKEFISWTVERRYSDFEALHKKLVDSQGKSCDMNLYLKFKSTMS